MQLSDHIRRMGDREFAEYVGVPRRTVTEWKLGNRLPRPETAKRIVARFRGKITLIDIYGR